PRTTAGAGPRNTPGSSPGYRVLRDDDRNAVQIRQRRVLEVDVAVRAGMQNEAAIDRGDRGPGCLGGGEEGVVQLEHVAGRQSVDDVAAVVRGEDEGVGAGAALEEIVAGPAVEQIVAVAAVEHVGAG